MPPNSKKKPSAPLTLIRPHFAANPPKTFKDFSFLLSEFPRYSIKTMEFSTDLGSIGDFKVKSSNLKDYKSLSKFMVPSKLGKGKKTVYDKDLRNSFEILESNIKLESKFNQELKKQVDQMAKALKHPKEVELKLSKMVIYEKEGRFKSHIDANHQPNMILTLSVEIFMEGEKEGGELVLHVNDEEVTVPPPTKKNELVLTLFYHDVIHEVNELEKGVRFCLIFDVVEKDVILDEIVEEYEKDFNIGLKRLAEVGVNRIGIQLHHIYLGSNYEDLVMKGKDAISLYLVQKYCKKPEIFPVMTSFDFEASEEKYLFRTEVLKIMKFCDAFDSLYRDVDEPDSESDSEGERKENIKFDEYNDKLLNLDKENIGAAISKEFLLGDVVFLKGDSSREYIYKGASDLWLGNEGFTGSILKSLAIVATINEK